MRPHNMYMNKKTICVVGSGWGGSSFTKHIDTDKFNVIVISSDCDFLYTPLLPFSIFNNIILTVPSKSLNKNITICKDKVIDVNTDTQTLILDNNNKLSYDVVVFSHGASVNTFNIPGVANYCEFVKYDNDVQKIQNKLKNMNKMSNVVVIGCGPTGVETIGHIMDKELYNITAIDAMKHPLSMYPINNINYLYDLWKDKNVHYKMSSPVIKVTKDTIYTKNGNLTYDIAFWCGGIKPNTLTTSILKQIDNTQMPGIPVNEFLQIKIKGNHFKNLYAIGDCALGFGPPTAQKAYQQGKYLAENINSDNWEPFTYKNRGQITYIGDNKSVISSPYLNINGRFAGVIHKCVMVYNSMSFQQMKNICKAYIEK